MPAEELPDFLRLEQDERPLLMLGQEGLDTAEIEAAVHRENPQLEDSVIERLLVAAVRVGRHRFAHGVLRNGGHGCNFCGLVVRIGGRLARRMLVASHIKPWSQCDSRERVDVADGLAACPTHDTAFDTGLLTVDFDLSVRLRPDLDGPARDDPAVRAAFGRPPVAERLLLPPGLPPAQEYPAWHGSRVYSNDG